MKRKQLADGTWSGQYTYDLRGNLYGIDNANVTSASEPDSFQQSASYNARGQLVAETKGNGVASSYTITRSAASSPAFSPPVGPPFCKT